MTISTTTTRVTAQLREAVRGPVITLCTAARASPAGAAAR